MGFGGDFEGENGLKTLKKGDFLVKKAGFWPVFGQKTAKNGPKTRVWCY